MCGNEKVTQVLIISEDGREGTLVPWHKGKVISSSSSDFEIHLPSIAEFHMYGRGFLMTAFPGVKSGSKLCVGC